MAATPDNTPSTYTPLRESFHPSNLGHNTIQVRPRTMHTCPLVINVNPCTNEGCSAPILALLQPFLFTILYYTHKCLFHLPSGTSQRPLTKVICLMEVQAPCAVQYLSTSVPHVPMHATCLLAPKNGGHPLLVLLFSGVLNTLAYATVACARAAHMRVLRCNLCCMLDIG